MAPKTTRATHRRVALAGNRPVIIISRDAINHNSSVVVCVPCTDLSNCKKVYPSQVLLKKGTAKLDLDSVAMCEQMRAITTQRLGTFIGTLDQESLKAIETATKIALDLL